jgi:hypothetical protein
LQFFTYGFEKEGLGRFSRYRGFVIQKFKEGDLNNFFRYKALKLLRSYRAFKRNERVNMSLLLKLFYLSAKTGKMLYATENVRKRGRAGIILPLLVDK